MKFSPHWSLQDLTLLVCKLIAKAPIHYSLVRNINCLDPRNMMGDHDVSITKFKEFSLPLKMRRKFWKVTVIPFGNYLDNSFFSIRVQRLWSQQWWTWFLSVSSHGKKANLPIMVESSRRPTDIVAWPGQCRKRIPSQQAAGSSEPSRVLAHCLKVGTRLCTICGRCPCCLNQQTSAFVSCRS